VKTQKIKPLQRRNIGIKANNVTPFFRKPNKKGIDIITEKISEITIAFERYLKTSSLMVAFSSVSSKFGNLLRKIRLSNSIIMLTLFD